MGLLVKKKEKRSFTEEEREELISLLPGFQGTPSNWESINAIKDSDVFTAVHMIASDIASLDLEKRKNGIKDNNDKVSHLFNKNPNEFYTGYQLKFILVANALLNGESFAEVVKDNGGNVQGIYHIPNRKMTHKQDETTNFRLLYGVHEGNRTRWVKSDRILHFKFFSLDGITGISPLKALSDDIDT
ncbi:MAG TPA: phage portal protein, partial [Massilibacterium sp.]|nr:phage portal protein [Massilibacterium sp.]